MKKILAVYLRVWMFLFPLVLLPGVIDAMGWGRIWLMVAGGMVGLGLWMVGMLLDKEETVKFKTIWWLLAVLVIWAAAGWWTMLPGVRYKSLVSTSGIGVLGAGLMWLFLWLQVATKEEKKIQLKWLTAAGVVVVVTSLAVFLWPAARLPFSWPKGNPLVTISGGWSITGSLLSEIFLIAVLLLEWGMMLAKKLREKREDYMGEAVIVAVFLLGFLLSGYRMVKAGWTNLDGNTAWVIATETFKRKPLGGVGAGNFGEAFSLWRPASYNMTKYWSNGFNVSATAFGHLWTELGLMAVVLIVVKILGFLKQERNGGWVKMGLVGIAALLLPWNLMILWLALWLEANSGETKKVKLALKVGENGFNGAPWLIAVLLGAGVVAGGYWWTRVLIADIKMRQSLVAASKNDGGTTYNKQIEAIAMMSYAAEYRRVYSQTNMALATTILGNKEVTDEDRQKAGVLVQQAIREAKAAIALDSLNASYWSNLAVLYRQLVGVVDGSADWSFQAYQQAAVLDPTNPLLGLDLGGLLYAANRFEEADRVFEQVVVNKNDYANGWYNWAYSAKNLGKLGEAVQRMTQAVALVPVESGDYETASKELEKWKIELDKVVKQQEAQQKAPETLKTPQPLPTVGEEEKVNVPASELEPPKVSPTVKPEETSTP